MHSYTVIRSPPASSRRSCESRAPKVFPTIEVPDDRDLLDEVAYLWDGKIHGSTAGITPI